MRPSIPPCQRPTLPPSAAEAYAVGVFERAVRAVGEWRARMLLLAVKMGERPESPRQDVAA